MSVITILSGTVGETYEGSETVLVMRGYYMQPFTAAPLPGTAIVGSRLHTSSFFVEVPCTVAAGVVTYDSFQIHSTTDALSNPKRTSITFALYTLAGAFRSLVYKKLRVPANPTTTTLTALAEFTYTTAPPDGDTFYTAAQIDALLAALVGGIGSGFQPLDSDLTAIAALSAASAGAIASDGAGWIKKTYTQFKTALSLVKGDVGLGNVDNTTDASKPVSTAQQTALNGKVNNTGNESVDGIKTLTSAPLIPLNAYGAGWNGSQKPATEDAVYDKIEAVIAAVPGSYSDEQAQDAVGAMVDSSLTYVDGTPLLQRAALTGDITAPAGSNATTIANNAVTTAKILDAAVTLAKLVNIADQTILGNNTGGAAAPVALTASQVRTLLGLVIGTNVQAYDADLTTWAGLTPSANAQSLVTAADYAAMRSLLALVIGTNVQAWDTDLDAIAALAASNDDIVQRKSGAWTNRTMAQLAADLGTLIKSTESLVISGSDETTALTTGTGKITFRMPYAFTVTDIRASLTTAQTSGSIFTVDVNESGTSIISTKLTIDNTEKTTTTAATPPVISDASLADDAEITVDIDQVGDGTAKGLKVTIIGHRT